MVKYEVKQKKRGQGDAFISFFDDLLRWITQHRAKFFLLIGIILLVLVGSQVYFYLQASQAKKVANIYEKALKAEPDQALKAWELILERQPPLELSDFIRLNMAGIYAQQEKWQEAANIYEQLEASKLDYVRDLSAWSKALALENAKKIKEALKAYESLSAQTENPYQVYGKLGQARCLRQLKDFAKADKILVNLIENPEVQPPVKSEAMEQWMSLKIREQ
ncbi:MAG: hypothetical protein H7A32_04800 [Deltaproteobacteria bacterium]|nr:hypothetical protein [Deltaproteobacteria bacterium]